MKHLYFCWPWALASAWYLVLQVSSGYKMVVLNSDPMAPEVASDIDSRSTPISKIISKINIWVGHTIIEREEKMELNTETSIKERVRKITKGNWM